MTTLIYEQKTGSLIDAGSKELIGRGYSGHGEGVNNPSLQRLHDVGPLPCGHYRLGQAESPPSHRGPLAFPLTPLAGNLMFGRGGFLLHGDSAALDHSASLGCIIMAHAIRERLASRYVGCVLTVVSGLGLGNAPQTATPNQDTPA